MGPILKGKHKPTYTPHQDCGDYVVIINCKKVNFSGKKWKDKLYRWHTGYPGGLKQRTAKEMLARRPTEVLRKAITGMLGRSTLRYSYIEKRLKMFEGPDHTYVSQFGGNTGNMESTINIAPRAIRGKYFFGFVGKPYAPENVVQKK